MAALAIVLLFALFPRDALSDPREGSSLTLFFGQMTDNVWEETFQPWKIDPIDSHFIGIAGGYEWQALHPRVTLGFEAQLVAHFGGQDNLEFNLPLIVRYSPRATAVPALDGLAFGLGLSTTNKLPQTEIDRDGETSRTLVYWMAEFEFRLPREDTTLSFRLHHRSDAYGVFDTDSGSNALVVGVKWRF